MLKMLDASCAAGVVSIEGVPVPPADILSQGVGPSTGIALIEEDTVKYLTSNATDIKAAITSLNAMITQLITVIGAIDGSVNSGAQAAALALITTANAQFALTKDLLK